MDKLHALTACRLRTMIARENLDPAALLDDVLARIQSVDSRVKAFAHHDAAIARRRLADVAACKSGKLFGIPVVLKDNICVTGELTTCASRILAGFRPPYDATVTRKLKEAGAVLIGKTNMDEFAFGSSCETSCYGPTKNPWDLTCIPGGSSGGSAAAVASDQTILALGSDTGGSIRQPAALCGVVGMKPTYGRVSRYGLIAFASSLDQIGPITKDVRDAALLLEVIAGYDMMDSTSVDLPVGDYTGACSAGIKGMRIGVPKEYFISGISPEVETSVRAAITALRSLGATIVELSLPHTEYAVSTYYIVAPAEASSNLARFDGVQYGLRDMTATDIVDMYTKTRSQGFGNEAKRRILLGTYALSSGYYEAYYLRAQKVRTKIKEDFERAFQSCDCIITPTSPTPAFKIGERMHDPLAMYLSDIYTIPANLAGIPALSLPCGFSSTGLPIGAQILAKAFDEEAIFCVAGALEDRLAITNRRPSL